MQSLLRLGQASSSYKSLLTRACYKHAFSTTRAVARTKPKGGSRKARADFSPHFRPWGAKPIAAPPVNVPSSAAQRNSARKAYNVFRKVALERWEYVITGKAKWSDKQKEYGALGIDDQRDFDRETYLFRTQIGKACDRASEENAVSRSDNPLFWSLRTAFVDGEVRGLTVQLEYSFMDFLMRSRFPTSIVESHKKIADFRYPHEWFPATRALRRTVHLHVGPTNSGKTYNALKALENANSGIYSGPLRLLAHEVYSRFIAKGKKCALVTGEEQRVPENEDNYFRSCTVEMTPLNHLVDVAVIDEIQMIGDSDRGWAWTQAFLGVQAREVHLCGEERAVNLIQSLCATTGDKLEIHRYKRLSPLEVMNESLGWFGNLQKGDAVISFSRVDIHALKKAIEKETGKRAAVVYGALPPETRAQQAALFNEKDNDYDYLVASDAIGMGLNLEIKRVVFVSTHKRDKFNFRQISTSEIKQIGGRAGRYRTANHAITSGPGENQTASPSQERQVGLVTALEDDDLGIIQKAFRLDPEPLQTAGIQAPPSVVERMSSYFPPNTPFSYVISRLRDLAQISPRYHLCGLKEMLQIADLIQPYPMSVYDRCVFLNAPVFLREPNGAVILQAFARCVSKMEGGNLLDIYEINLELLDTPRSEVTSKTADYLRQLETLHKSITLYLWLSYRYSGVFVSQHLAFHVKEMVEEKINFLLDEIAVDDAARRKRLAAQRKAASKRQRKKEAVLGLSSEEEAAPKHEVPGEWNEEGHEEPLYQDPKDLKQVKGLEHYPQNNSSRKPTSKAE